MYRGFSSIAMEVINTYCFAKRFNIMEYPGYEHPAMVGFQDSNYTIFMLRHFPVLRRIIFRLPNWLTPGAAGRKVFSDAVLEQVSEILEDPSTLIRADHETIYHHLLSSAAGQRLGHHPALREHAISLVAAGTETIANTCTLATFYVLKDLKILTRLRRDLQAVWPDVDLPISLEQLEKIPYLTAVIQEALRLSHGIVTPLPRVVTEPTQIGPIRVPPGTIVAMSQTFVHLNPDIFPDPMRFDPERWIGPGSAERLDYLVPFSKGQRACVSINLAWAELYLILGNLFRKVDMKIFNTTDNDLKFRALLTPRFYGHLQVNIRAVDGIEHLINIA